VAGFCEHGNEIPVSIKCWDFPDCWWNITFPRRTQLHGVGKLLACTKYTSVHDVDFCVWSCWKFTWWPKEWGASNAVLINGHEEVQAWFWFIGWWHNRFDKM